MTRRPARIVLVSFGTRGDVLPFCVLGRTLAERGHEIRLVTTSDYHSTVERHGLRPVETGPGFADTLRDPRIEPLFRDYFGAGFAAFRALRHLRLLLQHRLIELMLVAFDEIARGDLVVFNPFAPFAGTFARLHGRPAVRVMCQPLLPSRAASLSLFGGRSFGRLGNRLSYEPFRLFSLIVNRSLAEVGRRRGVAIRARAFANHLTADLRDLHHVAAYSPTLSPDPGDWPVPTLMTGAWFGGPSAETPLQASVEAFLAGGPPPVYVGFGSMLWGGKRNTRTVMRALEIWGGRAIVIKGSGGMELPPNAKLPPNVVAPGHVNHALLFPRCAAVVHHGGAGTTAAGLRAGRPSVVLPMLGDQLYWGRRVAALGAGEDPVPLRQVSPDDLAARIARACSDATMRDRAARIAGAMATEPGVAAAAGRIDEILAREAVPA